MNIKTSGRSALIIAAGLWVFAAGPLQATEDGAQTPEPAATVGSATDTSAIEPAKATRHHSAKKTASKSRKSDRLAPKTAKKSTEEDTAKTDDAAKDQNAAANMSSAVANANAQWPADSTTNTANMGLQAGSVLSQMSGQLEQTATTAPDTSNSNMQVVAADQLNDLDRAISDNKPPLTLAKATIDEPAASVSRDNSSSNSPWDQTSLIGKIFIAFGGLLTMASAARMFMA